MGDLASKLVALALYGSFAAASGAFAATRGDTGFSKNVYDQIGGTPEMRLPIFSGMPTASTCDMNEVPVKLVEFVDSSPDAYIIDPDEDEAAALNWLENEMQMSIDRSSEPQGVTPDFTCMDPPYTCPSNVKCPDLGGGCVVTSCGMGECSICPIKTPGWIIRSWCAYGCIKGSKVVGGAFGFWVRGLGWRGPLCFPG